jgi:hypothetical protein
VARNVQANEVFATHDRKKQTGGGGDTGVSAGTEGEALFLSNQSSVTSKRLLQEKTAVRIVIWGIFISVRDSDRLHIYNMIRRRVERQKPFFMAKHSLTTQLR